MTALDETEVLISSRDRIILEGSVILLGFGSIGRGLLPLLERHFHIDPKRFIIIDEDPQPADELRHQGKRFMACKITPDNLRQVITPLIQEPGSFCINASINISSLALIELCNEMECLYIDASIEPWEGFLENETLEAHMRTNYMFRESMLALRTNGRLKNRTTAVTSCGANPGMVSWLVKQALLNLAQDLNLPHEMPHDRPSWARLMHQAGVKGIHIAEFDGQHTHKFKRNEVFYNTWSADGLIAEGWQPAELGWGTHERWLPETARFHTTGQRAGIYLMQPGASTRVFSWCPASGAKLSLLMAHYEALSISDYFTLEQDDDILYRPTCHYAYRPANAAIVSLYDHASGNERTSTKRYVLQGKDIIEGANELGVLLYGHDRNAYWYGSRLPIEHVRKVAGNQNATGLQVTSGMIAGMVWAIENPQAGIVEPEEMDFKRCLEIQAPYLGSIEGHYTDWNPLQGRQTFFPEDLDTQDPWQFKNILLRI